MKIANGIAAESGSQQLVQDMETKRSGKFFLRDRLLVLMWKILIGQRQQKNIVANSH